VRVTEDFEKENIRLKQRLLIIEEALVSVRKQESILRNAHSERIRISVIEERQWKLDKKSWEKWQMEGKVRIKELEGEIKEEIDKMIEEKERGMWGEGIRRGLGLAYEMGMKEEKGGGLTLTGMMMRGKIREGDGLCYKRGTTGKVVIGGEDLDDVSAGVESEGDVYESMGAWISAKNRKRVIRLEDEKLAKEMTVMRNGRDIGTLLSLWEGDERSLATSPINRVLRCTRASFGEESAPAMLELAVVAEAMRRRGEAAAQQMRIIVASSMTGAPGAPPFLSSATALLSGWAQVSGFLREFRDFVDKTCTSSGCNKSSGH
jgi:hypothetical protein